MSAPAAQSWIAFGFGTGMDGALIFVAYTSQDGKNVTLSPRIGSGHDMPTYTSDVDVAILAGTGVVDDMYVVNAQCKHCRKWKTGSGHDSSIDITSTAQPMIYGIGDAPGNGSPLKTNSQVAVIQQHSGFGKFTMNLKAATGGAGVPTNIQTQSGGTKHLEDNGSSGKLGSGVHAVLMLGTFIVVLPAGYLFYRLFERLWIHVVIQTIGVFGTILGLGSGIYISLRRGPVRSSPDGASRCRLCKLPLTDPADTL